MNDKELLVSRVASRAIRAASKHQFLVEDTMKWYASFEDALVDAFQVAGKGDHAAYVGIYPAGNREDNIGSLDLRFRSDSAFPFSNPRWGGYVLNEDRMASGMQFTAETGPALVTLAEAAVRDGKAQMIHGPTHHDGFGSGTQTKIVITKVNLFADEDLNYTERQLLSDLKTEFRKSRPRYEKLLSA